MNIDFVDEQDDPPSPHIEPARLVELVRIVLEGEGYPPVTEVALTMIDETPMGELNARHLGKDGPTDVLSFPIEDLVPGEAPGTPPEGMPLMIGDVIVCPAVVLRQAAARQVAFDDEMALMVVHGVLHLLGYDHAVDAEAEQMEARERAYLAQVGRVRP